MIRHVFNCWVEDWEKQFLKKNNVVTRERFEAKYKNLVWHDPDDDDKTKCFYTGVQFVVVWNGGWHVLAKNTEMLEEEKWAVNMVTEAMQYQETGDFMGDPWPVLKQAPELGIRVVLPVPTQAQEETGNVMG